MEQTTNNNCEWVRCEKCGHKLFKTTAGFITDKENFLTEFLKWQTFEKQKIEIKCHSCKQINVMAYI